MPQAEYKTLQSATDLDEAGLVAAARGGDLRAFESLYRALSPTVYGLCLRLVRDPAEAQDCLQETFVRAWRRLAEFRGESRLATWLHRIAVNEALTRKRRAAMEQRHLSAVDPGKRYVTNDPATLQDVERAIAKLPERARAVFVLHAVHGYAHEEVASMLAVTVGTSKTQLHRARRLLAGMLGLDAADDESSHLPSLEDAADAADGDS
jgi:RNA polymerase sigma-70 factor (ECF subfamily)